MASAQARRTTKDGVELEIFEFFIFCVTASLPRCKGALPLELL